MNINGYTLKAELKNANSGFSKWGFATKNGKEYFIKELINPVYPIDKSIMSEELFQQRRTFCSQYETKFKKFFGQINNASHGNLVRINDFFRCGGRYYLITEKVDGKSVSMDYIASLEDEKKLLLLKTVAHCFHDLHSAGIVHFDVKPSNILVKVTKSGNYVAKLIDFDSGFFKGEVLDNKELGGDLTYLAPETFLAIYGEDVHPDEKADIFGLGLVLHEYCCGRLPYYDENEYEYPYEAALDNGVLMPDASLLSDEICKLITSMLDADPQKRPSAEQIIIKLNELSADEGFAEITNITIHFDGHYGKSISVSPDKIKYRNTIHPSIAPETRNFPASYTAQKEKNITLEQYENIIDEISAVGLFDIITPHIDKEVNPGAVYQAVSVVYEDGTHYDYSTMGEPDIQFKKVSKVLSEYCDFPEIESSWYETEIESSDEAPVFTPPKPTESKKDDWFKPAGDL
ncbi:MAG: protein kinase [Clostridia bacterium]|nr:protein kinase [Clostridia bacterium]